ncbi:hypothetical protein AWB76_04079 [Caballeronia temeraria]|uniref:Uncharacterized protein n=1 Tax=Caballeronia temeraria TaxID=1777137 RepID=A0A158BDY0_9BURK|nr:hypothetical protein [Caballeronia temeraria]SAK68269.1 hypothetical protein AWB76_04079 [Caballeronia temeraria]
MQIFDITVPANSAFVVHAPGKYIKYLSGNNGGGDTRLAVTPGMQGSTKITLIPGQAYRVSDEAKKPDSWTLSNYANGAAIIGQVVVGDGKIDDNSIAGTVQVIDGGKARTLNNSAFTCWGGGSSVASQWCRVQLWNPANNPNRVVLETIFSLAASGNTAAILTGGSTQLGTLLQVGQPKRVGGTPSLAGLYTDNTAVQPSAYPSLALFGALNVSTVAAGYSPKEPFVIPPGYGLMLAANAAATSISADFEWYEEPNV